jgi:hypothetical protein
MDRSGSLRAVRIGRRLLRVVSSDFERLVARGAANEQPSPPATAFSQGTETHADPLLR